MNGKSALDPRGRRVLQVAAGTILLICVAAHIQLLASFLPADPGNHPDEAAHYVTGVMVYDYFRAGMPAHPIAFAQDFYDHYPKVALGHWPPGFYLIETVWFSIAGSSLASTRVLCMALVLACGSLMFFMTRPVGAIFGMTAAALFLSAPVVLRSSPLIMSDFAVALLFVSAMLLLEMALRRGGPALWIGFVALATAAILTKGSAWALAPSAAVLPFLIRNPVTGSFGIPRRAYWIAAIAVAICSAPFYVWVQHLHIGYPVAPAFQGASSGSTWFYELQRRLEVLRPLLSGSVVPLYVLPLVFVLPMLRIQALPLGAPACFAGILGQIAFQVVLPSTSEERYYLPSLIFCVALAVAGLANLPRIAQVSVLAFLVSACLYQVTFAKRPIPVRGYEAAIANIPRGSETLIVSNANGEGSLVARFLERDHFPGDRILRGSKALAQSEWNGQNYSLRYAHPAEVEDALAKASLSHILIDDQLPDAAPHISQCLEALSRSQRFTLERKYTVHPADSATSSTLELYGR